MGANRESLEEDAKWVRTIVAPTTDGRTREECFRKLYDKYWKLLVMVATQKLGDSREAEEVSQDAFVRAFRALDHLSEPVAFLGWLLRIAQNLATDRLRARRPTVSLDALTEGTSGFETANSQRQETEEPERALELQEEVSLALKVLGELPDRYREVLNLRYLQGLDGKDMARLLGEPEGTVRNRLFRALEKMKSRLEQRRACRS